LAVFIVVVEEFAVVYCCIEDKIYLNNMAFLNKFKNLIFSRKRGKSGKKGETCDVGLKPICQEDIEVFNKKLEERDDLIILLEKKIEEKEREMHEMQATFGSEISGLLKKLQEKENERCQVEVQRQLELKETEEKYRKMEQTAASLRCQMEKMKRKLETTENHCQERETLLKSQIELQGNLEEKICIYREKKCYMKRIETALREQVNELKQKIEGMESDRGILEETLSCQIELQRNLQEQIWIYREDKRDWKRIEEALRGQVKDLKKEIERVESDRVNLEHSLHCHMEKQDDESKPTEKDGKIVLIKYQDHQKEEEEDDDDDEEEEQRDPESIRHQCKFIRYLYNQLAYFGEIWNHVCFLYASIHFIYDLIIYFYTKN